jgi:hypothetical protein
VIPRHVQRYKNQRHQKEIVWQTVLNDHRLNHGDVLWRRPFLPLPSPARSGRYPTPRAPRRSNVSGSTTSAATIARRIITTACRDLTGATPPGPRGYGPVMAITLLVIRSARGIPRHIRNVSTLARRTPMIAGARLNAPMVDVRVNAIGVWAGAIATAVLRF